MYKALYRRFRPETFSQVLGQEHIVKILSSQIKNDTTGHAYLFCGTRGTGKTTMARLLAKGVNCLAMTGRPCGSCRNCQDIRDGVFVDVIEIDAASNNGVENIRELKESVKYPPTAGRCKVYIIDEVHMLSTGAFNALLKTLEEPPEHVIFVLATTEPQKLPATILSRCLRLDFRRIPAGVIRRGMAEICAELSVDIDENALLLLSANADGSVRDGLSLLDQCITAGEQRVTRDTVLELLGSPGEVLLTELTALAAKGDTAGALLFLDQMLRDGKDERQIMQDWIVHYRNLMLLKYIRNPEEVLNLSLEHIDQLRDWSQELSLDRINAAILILAEALNDARWSGHPRILLELAVIRMTQGEDAAPQEPQPAQPAAAALAQGRPPVSAAQPETTAPAKATAPPETAAQEGTAGVSPTVDAMREPGKASLEPVEKPEETQAPAPAQEDLDGIWKQVAAEAARLRGSLSGLEGRSRLTGMNSTTAFVTVSNDILRRNAEMNRAELGRILARLTGIERKLEYRVADDRPAHEEKNEQLAQEIGRKLRLDVEIE